MAVAVVSFAVTDDRNRYSLNDVYVVCYRRRAKIIAIRLLDFAPM